MSKEKVALLLLPEHIGITHHIVGTLHINKPKKDVQFDQFSFSSSTLKKHFGDLSKQVSDALFSFCDETIFGVQDAHQQKIKQQKSGLDRDKVFKNMMQRYLHQSLQRLKPFSGQLKWYHSVRQGNNRNKLAP